MSIKYSTAKSIIKVYRETGRKPLEHSKVVRTDSPPGPVAVKDMGAAFPETMPIKQGGLITVFSGYHFF